VNQDDFNPSLFLTEVHQKTPFRRLEEGRSHLERTISNSADAMKRLVGEHFDEFVNCKETIDGIHQRIADEISKSDSRTSTVQRDVAALQQTAVAIYAPLLTRKREIDRIRKSLEVLKKFRFVFSLPASIRKHIRSRAYDKVIRDFQKANAIIVQKNSERENESQVLDMVLQEVQQVVADFRKELFKKLENNRLPLQDQLATIGYLYELDCSPDPAWFYLKKQEETLCSQFDACGTEFRSKMSKKDAELKQHATAARAEEETEFKLGSLRLKRMTSDQFVGNDVVANTYVHKMCSILERSGPGFFGLAQDIQNGKFVKVEKFSALSRQASTLKSARDDTDGKSETAEPVPREKSGGEQKEGVKKVVDSVVCRYALLVRQLLFPVTMAESSLPNGPISTPESRGQGSPDILVPPFSDWFQDSLLEVLRVAQLLTEAKISPEYLRVLGELRDDLIRFFIVHSFRTILFNIGRMSREETWQAHPVAPGATLLVERFRVMMQKALSMIKKLGVPAHLPIVDMVVPPFNFCLQTFADVLQLLFRQATSSEISPVMMTDNEADRKMLAVLNNTLFCGNLISSFQTDLQRILPPVGHAKLSALLEETRRVFSSLEKYVLNGYIRSKSVALLSTIKYNTVRLLPFCRETWLTEI